MSLRRALLVAALALAVGMLVVGNILAIQAGDLFVADAGGLSVFVNAIGLLVLSAVGVGVIIDWRVPGNRIAWLLIVGALVVMSVFICWPLAVVLHERGDIAPTAGGLIAWWATVALLPGLFLLFPAVALVFPDGRLPGSRWRFPVATSVALLGIGVVLQTIGPWVPSKDQPVPNPFALPDVPTAVSEVGGAVSAIAIFLALALAVAGIVARYRRSSGVEKAQMKWLVAAVSLTAVLFPLSFSTDIGPADLIDVGSVLGGTLIPIAIGIAILRYRLYDIDRIVSRTVSWAVVTGILVAVFVAGVLASQAILAGVTRGETEGETLAVAVSTLLAFALFQPVRRYVQRAVDRRFDRSRYDGARIADAFAERLRDEVDLQTLADDLDDTVRASVAPALVGLWLRRAEP